MDKEPAKHWIVKSNRMDRRPQLPPVYTTEPLTVRTVLQLYFNTFLGANFAESWVYPLDVAKTRMQVEGEEAKKTGAKIPNALATLRSIVKNEGPKTLYAGFSAMVARNLIFNSMRVVLYDIFRRKFIRLDENNKETLAVSSALSCGFVAGCIAQAMANPFDIVKVRMQTEGRRRIQGHKPRVTNMFNAFTGIYREGGLPHMWKGITPSCLRACLMTAGDVGTYDLSKRFFKDLLQLDDGLRLRFLSSMCAGFTASVLSNPADVIKSRVMNQQTDAAGKNLTYKNSMDCLIKTVSEEGPLALYKGLLPCWFRLGPFSVLFWMSVEFLRDVEGQAGF
ncbi:mitochondrial uncoupling protein 4C-like [Drosophila obscura]|uniref:mitochondrial uncoupling protein 4C-like n=1 Tax=Drosophila obscura TaxID=7282 RepID=UPI001BB2CB38|nr:mitochondrial uncoupling protein 4C-like [Drosophila obscura]